MCFLKSVELLQSYGHLTNHKTGFWAGFKKVSPYQPKEGLKLKNYKIRQEQTFSDLAQAWHTGSLGQVFRRDFFVWLKNRNGQDIDKNGQKNFTTTNFPSFGSNLAYRLFRSGSVENYFCLDQK